MIKKSRRFVYDHEHINSLCEEGKEKLFKAIANAVEKMNLATLKEIEKIKIIRYQ